MATLRFGVLSSRFTMDFSINGMKREKKEIREIHMQNRRLVEIQISVLAKQTDI